MSFFNRTGQAVLNSLLGKTSNFGTLSSVPTIFVGLSSTAPAEGGTNITEPTTGGYARQATVAADWTAATLADPASIENANAVTYAQATADYLSQANLTYFVLFDAITGGNPIAFALLTTAKPILNGDTPSFPAGDLTLTLD